MKILHIITSLKLGGAETLLYNILSVMKNNKQNEHRVAYFYEGPNADKIKGLEIKTYYVKGFLCTYDRTYFTLKNITKDFKPDIIHSSLWSANIISRFIAKKFNIPLICDLQSESAFIGKFRNWLDYKTILIPQKFIAISEGVKQSYINDVVSYIKNNVQKELVCSKIIVIKNGIDSNEIRKKAYQNTIKRQDFGLKETDFVIGGIGRLEPIKSYDLLIKSFAKALSIIKSQNTVQKKDLKLCIVGDGSQFKKLKKLVLDLKIENSVVFTGAQKDVYRFYPLFDCFALSSKVEGISIALLEALAFGLPIITTNKDLNHEVIKHNVNGIVISNRDIDQYADAIKTIYFYEPYMLEKINQLNKSLVEKDFNLNDVVEKYEQVYMKSV